MNVRDNPVFFHLKLRDEKGDERVMVAAVACAVLHPLTPAAAALFPCVSGLVLYGSVPCQRLSELYLALESGEGQGGK